MNIECDVLVVGAGTAGIPAAVAAARTGADTHVLEGRALPGGAALLGVHRGICGLFVEPSPGTPAPPMLHDGLVREICERVCGGRVESAARRIGRVLVLPFRTGDLADVAARALAETRGLHLHCGMAADGVAVRDGRIHAVSAHGGAVVIRPRCVVDATGSAAVARLARAPLVEPAPGDRQLAGFGVRLAGVDERPDDLALAVPAALRRAVDAGLLPRHLRFTVCLPGDAGGEVHLKLSIPDGRPGGTPAAAEDARAAVGVLAARVPAFRHARIAGMSPELLPRDGCRLAGSQVLTEADVLGARRFPDGVARNAWPVEFWDPVDGPRLRYPPPGRFYEIPLGCMTTPAIGNLICTGRAISATARALGSARVMGACMALGEAAGLEAVRRAGKDGRP